MNTRYTDTLVINKKTDTLPLGKNHASSSSIAENEPSGSSSILLNQSTIIAQRYRVVREVSSSGGQADIFLCDDTVTGSHVILKIYRENIFPKEDLLRELLTLKHGNIVKLKGFTKWNQRFIEIMEYCTGGSLKNRMPFEEKYLQEVIIPQVTEGLHYLHKNKIIHRDIKPNNMFVKENHYWNPSMGDHDKILLGDFGISSLVRGECTFVATNTRRSTFEFSAPELSQGFFAMESDYYALGISLIFLVSGKNPFEGLSVQRIMAIHASEDIPMPRCSDRFKALIQGLVHKARKKRWGYEEIRKWLNGENVVVWPQEYNQQQSFSYKLDDGLVARNARELAEMMLKHPDLAKKHIRQSQFYDSFNIYDQALASQLQDIRERAGNLEEMYVETIYLLNPELPYRLLDGYEEVRSPTELAKLIDRDRMTWEAGKEQLYNGCISAWLRATGYEKIARNWQDLAKKFSK